MLLRKYIFYKEVYMKAFWCKAILVSVMISFLMSDCYALSDSAREKGFVYLHEIDPTILVSLRYLTHENFVGKPVDGYLQPVVIMTVQAAQALKKVQEEVKKDGYCLVVYDAYRPQQAVSHFVRWGKDVNDSCKKSYYYPYVSKKDVFELGYVAYKSGHSRGSTVDITLIKDGDLLHEVQAQQYVLTDGRTITWLDDGTIFMGSSFDLFDEASHANTDLVELVYQEKRKHLNAIMEKHGFVGCAEEWWHFTLKNEPYSKNLASSHFDFVVE